MTQKVFEVAATDTFIVIGLAGVAAVVAILIAFGVMIWREVTGRD